MTRRRPSLKNRRETLPASEQFCYPCKTALERTDKPIPGLRTWRCPNCHKVYSDARLQTFSHEPNSGRFKKGRR